MVKSVQVLKSYQSLLFSQIVHEGTFVTCHSGGSVQFHILLNPVQARDNAEKDSSIHFSHPQ